MVEPPRVECESVHPSLPVRDVRAAADFYAAKLGFRTAFTVGDPPTMAGVDLGRAQVFLEKAAQPRETSVYFVVEDADELHAHHRAMGVDVVEPLRDQPYGLRDYAVRDLDGNRLAFGHHLFNAGPPIPVERVDLTVRLEKRLAAVLHDLAAQQRKSVAACLEEILCHTNDGVTPHTPRTVERIQELKRRHGIDYDTHGSYRFAEERGP